MALATPDDRLLEIIARSGVRPGSVEEMMIGKWLSRHDVDGFLSRKYHRGHWGEVREPRLEQLSEAPCVEGGFDSGYDITPKEKLPSKTTSTRADNIRKLFWYRFLQTGKLPFSSSNLIALK